MVRHRFKAPWGNHYDRPDGASIALFLGVTPPGSPKPASPLLFRQLFDALQPSFGPGELYSENG
jgi:hypothetical protein